MPSTENTDSCGFVPPHDQLDARELATDDYLLLRPLWCRSKVLGGRTIKVASSFRFDKESIPRWLPWTYAWLAGTASRAGCVHDWLYQTHQVQDLAVTRRMADAVYYEALAYDGNGGVRRWVKWIGVRIGGAHAYRTGPGRFSVRFRDRRSQPRT